MDLTGLNVLEVHDPFVVPALLKTGLWTQLQKLDVDAEAFLAAHGREDSYYLLKMGEQLTLWQKLDGTKRQRQDLAARIRKELGFTTVKRSDA